VICSLQLQPPTFCVCMHINRLCMRSSPARMSCTPCSTYTYQIHLGFSSDSSHSKPNSKKWASHPSHPFRLWKIFIIIRASHSVPLFQQPFSGRGTLFFTDLKQSPDLPLHLQVFLHRWLKSQPSLLMNNLAARESGMFSRRIPSTQAICSGSSGFSSTVLF